MQYLNTTVSFLRDQYLNTTVSFSESVPYFAEPRAEQPEGGLRRGADYWVLMVEDSKGDRSGSWDHDK